MRTKACSKCRTEKPLEDFSPQARGLYGRQSECRECVRVRQNLKNKQRRESGQFDTPTEKRCPSCETVKPSCDFNKGSGRDGLASYCRKCSSVCVLEWQKENRERANKRMQDWRKKNKKREREAVKARREANREREIEYQRNWRDNNKDKARLYGYTWAKKNPMKIMVYNATRRSAKLNATPGWLTPTQLAEIDGIYLYASIFGLTVDHIVPLRGKTVCGLHVPWNLQPMTAQENYRKGNRIEGYLT